ncbi:hypothetical protein HUO13_11905 [Saccharopolyspora erythraea]|uniref:hypothetical protein n=1 Tax=Saccharopolyspora erythraea TaxID=1836 RepID=UPI001BAB5D7B|nr:hypothetical protein [Saccharopolyspora erythraea]QUH01419.1 hypothetical protein HUO13_11905 [Saccharopolyspora erythraea]
MTEEELKAYAKELILEHAHNVEYLTIHEMAEDYAPNGISDADAKKVDRLIHSAKVTVDW